MNSVRLVIPSAFLFTMTFLACTGVGAQVYSGPKCLGPACIDRNTPFEEVAQRLGGPSSSGGMYGYRAKDAEAFLIITDGGQRKLGLISLPDFAEYGTWTQKDGKVATEDIRDWKTPEGIGLGSLEADVLRAYGRPSGIGDLELEDSSSRQGKRLLDRKSVV